MTTKTSAQKQREIEEYWARRNRELEAAWHKKCKRTIEKELAAYYMQALRHIDDDISELYARFADQNGLDMTAAQRMLQGDEFRVWRMDIADYVQQIAKTGDKELLRELNVLAMRSRITRLDKLRGDTLVELAKLSAKVEKSIGKFLPSAYKDFYYHGLYEIGKKAGIAVPVAKVDAEKLENVTRIPWSGKNYSARIWHNSAELGKTIEQTMLTAMHRGSSLPDLSRYVAQRMNVGIHSAERLVQTELNFVQNKAALDSIKDAGMKYFRFIATLDRRTTPTCRAHDGQTYEVESASVGTNMPPLHPRCRSTISGCLRALKDKPPGTRIARNDDTGKTYHVPAAMKYEEWKTVYVDKGKHIETWMMETGPKIPEGKYNLTIRRQVQAHHIDGTPEHDAYVKKLEAREIQPSILADDIDPQQLVKEFHGRGIYSPSWKDNSTREDVYVGKIVGKYWDMERESLLDTLWCKIVYSKKGTHIYPIRPRSEYDDVD